MYTDRKYKAMIHYVCAREHNARKSEMILKTGP